jgi:hypothetical protein
VSAIIFPDFCRQVFLLEIQRFAPGGNVLSETGHLLRQIPFLSLVN